MKIIRHNGGRIRYWLEHDGLWRGECWRGGVARTTVWATFCSANLKPLLKRLKSFLADERGMGLRLTRADFVKDLSFLDGAQMTYLSHPDGPAVDEDADVSEDGVETVEIEVPEPSPPNPAGPLQVRR